MVAHLVGGDAQVGGCGGQAAMSQQQLDRAHVGARFQQMDGERVSHGVRCDGFGDPAEPPRCLTGLLDSRPADMTSA